MDLGKKAKFGKEVEQLPLSAIYPVNMNGNENDIALPFPGTYVGYFRQYYSYEGDATGVWTLEPAVDGQFKTLRVTNNGTGKLTINSDAANDDILYKGVNLASIELPVGGILEFYGAMGKWELILFETGTGSKAEKRIPDATQYTAVAEDKFKHLVFENSINFIIPINIFGLDDEIEWDVEGGDVTVVEDTGMTVNQVASFTKVVPQYGVGHLRFKSPTIAILYGSLNAV